MKAAPPSNPGSKLVDEFDAYSRVFRENSRYRRREFFYLATILVCLVIAGVAAMQPPVVIMKDATRPAEPPQLLTPGNAPEIRNIDAEAFFTYVVRRRYGWDSATVLRDLEEINLLMTPPMKAAFQGYVNGREPSDDDTVTATEHPSRVATWMKAMVKNTVALPRDDLECRHDEVEGVWYCHGFGWIDTFPMFAQLGQGLSERRRVEFRSKLLPFQYTEQKPWGMVIAYLDALDVTGEK
ncbi:MAG: hypothetical protein ABIJ09_17625 [Pseudomonadota bacterium]